MTADARSRILIEATRLFADRGFDGTPIEDIARAAGVTRPTLVYHFGSKVSLRDAVLSTLLSHWRDELPTLLAKATSGSDRFRSAIEALVSFFHADPARARLLIREMLDRPREMGEMFRVHLQPWTRLITDYVRQGQHEGRIRATVDPEAYVLHVLNSVIATTAATGTQHVLAEPPDLERQLAELQRIARTSLFNERRD